MKRGDLTVSEEGNFCSKISFEKKVEVGFQVEILPHILDGIQTLWEFVFEIEEKRVFEYLREFLIHLYLVIFF